MEIDICDSSEVKKSHFNHTRSFEVSQKIKPHDTQNGQNIISKGGSGRYILCVHDVVSRLSGTQLKKAGGKAVKGTAGEIVTNGEALVGFTELPNRLCLQGKIANVSQSFSKFGHVLV